MVVKKQVEANEGDIVVALVDNQNTLKRYYRDDEHKKIILHPENKKRKILSLMSATFREWLVISSRKYNRGLCSQLFLFLSNDEGNNYFCRSFFSEEKMDYSKNQESWTLLYKKKIDLSTGENREVLKRLKESE